MRKNPDRITTAWLEKRIGLVNDMLGRPATAYTKLKSGKLKQNKGHLYIDHAYGGVGVEEMLDHGVNDISGGHEPKRELNNFINGMIAAIRLIESKRRRNPITEGQLENFVYELDTSGRYDLEGALKISVMESKDFSISPNKRQIYKDLAKLIRKELKKFSPSRNPKRRTVAKKKRTAKQRAATKKMLAANRARLRKKTKTARRKTRRNPQKARPGLTPARRAAALKRIDASKGFVVFKCSGKTVMFLLFSMTRAPHWTKDKKSAAGFRIKAKAEGVARKLIYKTAGGPKIGVAPVSMAASEIARQCQGKA